MEAILKNQIWDRAQELKKMLGIGDKKMDQLRANLDYEYSPPKVTKELLDSQGKTLEDLDLLVMHQANLRINEAAQRALRLPGEKVYNNIQKYGNTTSATLPLCFHEARAKGKAPEGSLVAFTALGAGLHWGSVLVRV